MAKKDGEKWVKRNANDTNETCRYWSLNVIIQFATKKMRIAYGILTKEQDKKTKLNISPPP